MRSELKSGVGTDDTRGSLVSFLSSLTVDLGGAPAHGQLAEDLQPRAAPCKPRPGAAAGVSTEASTRRGVSLRTVYLTGKLTVVLQHLWGSDPSELTPEIEAWWNSQADRRAGLEEDHSSPEIIYRVCPYCVRHAIVYSHSTVS